MPPFFVLSTTGKKPDLFLFMLGHLRALGLRGLVFHHGDFHDVERVVRIYVGREFHVMALMPLQFLRVLDGPYTLVLIINDHQRLAAFCALLGAVGVLCLGSGSTTLLVTHPTGHRLELCAIIAL